MLYSGAKGTMTPNNAFERAVNDRGCGNGHRAAAQRDR